MGWPTEEHVDNVKLVKIIDFYIVRKPVFFEEIGHLYKCDLLCHLRWLVI